MAHRHDIVGVEDEQEGLLGEQRKASLHQEQVGKGGGKAVGKRGLWEMVRCLPHCSTAIGNVKQQFRSEMVCSWFQHMNNFKLWLVWFFFLEA